jgi:hypothetical protein
VRGSRGLEDIVRGSTGEKIGGRDVARGGGEEDSACVRVVRVGRRHLVVVYVYVYACVYTRVYAVSSLCVWCVCIRLAQMSTVLSTTVHKKRRSRKSYILIRHLYHRTELRSRRLATTVLHICSTIPS